MDVNRSGNDTCLVLPAILNLTESEELLQTLRELNAGEGAYMIDASALTRISTPNLQILLAAIKENARASINAPSLQFLTAIADLGLSEHFDKRIVLE